MNRVAAHIMVRWVASFLLFILAGHLAAQTYNLGISPATNGASISTCSGMFYDSVDPPATMETTKTSRLLFALPPPASKFNWRFHCS
ncbi:MAG: hypothetical protein ACKO7B_20475, partial [Flavobacteriales bacterium]